MKRLKEWVGGIPHLFSKLVVTWCVVCGTAFSLYALRILSHTGHDPSALLGVILAFLGGELALLFGRDALKGKKSEGKDEEL